MNETLAKKARIGSWALQIVAAVILGQTLFFKFTGAEESRHIFETLGAEPWGRFGSGIAELLAVLLLLNPRRAVFGALLTLGLMAGAIGSHFTLLGIEVAGDGGALFAMAWITLLSAAGITWLRRSELPFLHKRVPGVEGR